MVISCDVFCNVIDNYGDIGVCWRLARQLSNEHDLSVRLWVDDLASFAKLCPEADAALDVQHCRGVEVRHWVAEAFHPLPQPLSRERERGAAEPAELVIEAFACRLPEPYIEAMAAQEEKPVWINLEYLSAEDWVEGCHKLPSPHPRLPLEKHFFFPGFTRKTGGLLLERDLFARRDGFFADEVLQREYWRGLGIALPAAGTLTVSMFGYENEALAGLFNVWADGARPVLCLVPEGRILAQAGRFFGDEAPRAGNRYVCGSLTVHVLPFVEQGRYDELLWACDVNFVRGEDSCVRAQWAGKPFVWQIYPQHDAVHWEKLQAFLDRYLAPLSPETHAAVTALWKAWNEEAGAGAAWPAFELAQAELRPHAGLWAQELSENNLALNLLDFFREIGRMRAFKI